MSLRSFRRKEKQTGGVVPHCPGIATLACGELAMTEKAALTRVMRYFHSNDIDRQPATASTGTAKPDWWPDHLATDKITEHQRSDLTALLPRSMLVGSLAVKEERQCFWH
jgi:hypothetical protein